MGKNEKSDYTKLSWSLLVNIQDTWASSRLLTYMLTLATMLFILKIRLVGDSSIAALIDSNYLVGGVSLMLLSVVFSFLVSFVLFFCCPPEIIKSPNTEDYLDRVKKRQADDNSYQEFYKFHLAHWEKQNFKARIGWARFVSFLLLVSLLLSLACVVVFFVAVLPAVLPTFQVFWDDLKSLVGLR